MRIGAFIVQCETTKDTVRHYEQLNLIRPHKSGTYKEYGEKELEDFQAIKEMQGFGLSLSQIQQIFCVKTNSGCGSPRLIQSVLKALKKQSAALAVEEQSIKHKRMRTEQLIKELELIQELSPNADREHS
ncbi:MerR family transcriptional regulator [Sporolactobacillus inulinus]|uniref:HTH merR-type domain-containing protein n=1 Tax=Sporolactobacillus inulinus CASD TaxID=1069536 RepID=A0A0U1QKX5_9BACL|nr:MerR family transcriptional regulator [Sporolactobacillus inulinus]KLI01401.1 hypothetical protein SINU_13660 [Sporolactobacillus inulinus CASD]GEB77308.1 hypothetical protein SIN01_16530 [Sporolactobacillus inulinus]